LKHDHHECPFLKGYFEIFSIISLEKQNPQQSIPYQNHNDFDVRRHDNY